MATNFNRQEQQHFLNGNQSYDLSFSALGASLLAFDSNDKESANQQEFVPSPSQEVLVEI